MRQKTWSLAIAVALGMSMACAAPATAQDVDVQGHVTWAVVHAQTATLLFVPASGNPTQVPIFIIPTDPTRQSGTYTVSLPAGDYLISLTVKDCFDVNCANSLVMSFLSTVPSSSSSAVIDIVPPTGFGAVHASGTLSLVGDDIVAGAATFNYAFEGALASGVATVPFGPDGAYQTTIGAGSVLLAVAVQAAGCSDIQPILAVGEAVLGEDLTLDTLAVVNCQPDRDIDNDGVLDTADLCPGTLPGAPVNAQGCSIAQLCPCDAAWKNHGAYVAAVVHTAKEFVAAGIITEAERDAVIAQAARSSCGTKK
jgi:hypothetical protein